MKTLTLTASQRSAVEIYVVDPAIEQAAAELDDRAPLFELRGNTLTVLVDDETACVELIEAANSADEDGPGAGGRALMNLCRAIRNIAQHQHTKEPDHDRTASPDNLTDRRMRSARMQPPVRQMRATHRPLASVKQQPRAHRSELPVATAQ